MVYKAIQSFFAEKASAFLPGKDFFPEEDKYASQFDPWSSGNRPIVRPWFNISINIQIGAPAPPATAAAEPPPYDHQPRPMFNPRDEPPYREMESAHHHFRERQRGALERAMGQGHAYGNSTIQGHGVAHFGDVHNHHHYFYAHTMQRRASSPAATLSNSMAYEALLRRSARRDSMSDESAVSDTPPASPVKTDSASPKRGK